MLSVCVQFQAAFPWHISLPLKLHSTPKYFLAWLSPLSFIIKGCLFISLSCCIYLQPLRINYPGTRKRHLNSHECHHLNSNGQRQRVWGMDDGINQEEVLKGFFPLQNFFAIGLFTLRIGTYAKFHPKQLHYRKLRTSSDGKLTLLSQVS